MYRSCIELFLEIFQLPFLGQISGPRVRPYIPICDLGFVIEVEHIREDFVPTLVGFHPREIRPPLNVDFAGLHIDHIRKEFHVFVGQVFRDDAKILRWLRERAAEEWREGG